MGVSDDTAGERQTEKGQSADGRTESAFPDSPRCGDPVATVTAAGPLAARAHPCGCRVPQRLLESD